VLNEQNRDVVPEEMVVALGVLKLHRGAAYIAREIVGVCAASHVREPLKAFCLHGWVLEKRPSRDVAQYLIDLEATVRPGAPRVDNSLGNAPVFKVRDLSPLDEIFEQCRPAFATLS